MNSDTPKPLIEVGGKPILARTLEAMRGVKECLEPLVVVGFEEDKIRRHFGELSYVQQAQLDGTGAAARACIPKFGNADGVLIVNGDHPLITSQSIDSLVQAYYKEHATLALFTATVENFEDWRAALSFYGRIIRDSTGQIVKNVEYKEASEEERQIREVNPNMYCVETQWLASALGRIQKNEVTSEYHLTDILQLARLDNVPIVARSIPPEEALGCNTREDIERAERFLRK